jgi:hypothetical protein
MTTVTLTPADTAPSTRQLALATSGLAPTEAVPLKRGKDDTPPAHAPCAVCGAMVLSGATADGVRLALDTDVRTYAVLWLNSTAVPQLRASSAYPVHTCKQVMV